MATSVVLSCRNSFSRLASPVVRLSSSGIYFRFNPSVVQIRCISKSTVSSSSGASSRLYSDKHEWVTVEGKIGKVGISQFAQEALGDIVYAQLPDVGAEFSQHDECGALESVKAASELYTPVSGKVTAKNTSLEETPGLINKSCYDKGWLFTIELKNPDELKNLMDDSKYEAYLKSQAKE